MRLSRDNLIVLGIAGVVVTTYVLVIYRAQSSALESVGARAAQARRQLEADALRASHLPPMVRQIDSMKQRYDKDWERRLPHRTELAEFLREIASGLAAEKLSNQIIQPGNPTRGSLYHCLPISVQFEGDFLTLASLLRRVDEMTRLTRIERLKIEPGKDGQDLAIQLGMNIYFTEQ